MLRLRPLTKNDAAMVFKWRNQPEIRRNMYNPDPIPWEDHLRWIDRVVDAKEHRYWIGEWKGIPAGLSSLTNIDPVNRRAVIGGYNGEEIPEATGAASAGMYLVLEKAFGELGLHKLTSEIIAFNARTLSYDKRFGFHVDGVLRDHVWRDGRFYDVYTLSLLEDEWRKHREKIAGLVRMFLP